MMERKFRVYRLVFHGPFHFSRGRDSYDVSSRILHSDTLQAAIFSTALQLGESPEEAYSLMEATRVSSAFPYVGEEIFFPKPFSKLPRIEDVEDGKQSKWIKKLEFIGGKLFFQLLNGELNSIQSEQLAGKGSFLSEHAELSRLMEKESDMHLLKAATSQRVAIPEEGSDPDPYYMDRVYMAQGSGLFFLAEFTHDDAQARFESALRLLGENGVGTDRSVGNGCFSVGSVEDLTIPLPAHSCHVINLSLFCPSMDEVPVVLMPDSSYNLVKRGGYISSPSEESKVGFRKRSVFMFQEGSVFPSAPLQGRILDLRPSTPEIGHPVWRDGRAIFLPFNPLRL